MIKCMGYYDDQKKLHIVPDIPYNNFTICEIPEEKMRPCTRYLKNNNTENKKLIGVEIGVKGGTNSKSILHELPIKTLYLVDNFSGDCEKFYMNFKKNVFDDESNKEKIVFIRKLSSDAASEIPNDLDFVYLDGSNDSDVYYNDICVYYDKVKIGGLIGGQLGWPQSNERPKGLKQFLSERNLKVVLNSHAYPSVKKGGVDWFIIKK